MDIKKEYFELIKKKVNEAYDLEHEQLRRIAVMFGECMDNLGVVQLFGVRHGEEFVNELNYRAGGIAPFHAYKFRDLILNKKLEQSKIDSGEVYSDLSVIESFEGLYELDDRDMYCLVSFYGNEPLVIELAKRAKARNQKVVGVVNKKSYDAV